MSLAFDLCDLQGNVIGGFDQRSGVEITLGLPQQVGPAKAQLTVSMDEGDSTKVKALSTRLRVLLDGHPILYGPVGTPKKNYGEGTVTISAADPGVQLENSFVEIPLPWPLPPTTVDPETGEVLIPPDWQVFGLTFAGWDQGHILAALVNHARPAVSTLASGVPDHGIGIGSLPLSIQRDRSYEPGKQVFGAMVELTQVRGGPDFMLDPVLGLGSTCCLLNVYPSGLGENRSATVVLVYGAEEANCRDMVEDPQGFATRNRFTSLGQAEQGVAPPFWISHHPESLFAHGMWEGFEGRPDVSEGPTTKQHAEGEVSKNANPPVFIDITPALEPGRGEDERLGIPPRFGPRSNPEADYWIGDTVKARAKRGAHSTDREGRVVSVTLTETDAGLVHAKPTLAPPLAAGVTTAPPGAGVEG